MSANQSNACGGASNLIFPCSGGSDVGALSDLAARQMTRDGSGKMYCLAGVGAQIPGILSTTRGASKILAVDGCPMDCARKILERAGFSQFVHLRLSDAGFQKGASPSTPDNVSKVAAAGCAALAG